MAEEGTPDNTTGVFKADETSQTNTTGVLAPGKHVLSKQDTAPIDPFLNEQYQSARGQVAADNIHSFEEAYNHGQTTWGDWMERFYQGSGEIYHPFARAIMGGLGSLSDLYYNNKKQPPVPDLTSLAAAPYYDGADDFATNIAKVVANPSYAVNNMNTADNTQRWFDSQKIKKELKREEETLNQPLHQGLREGKWGDRVGVTAANLVSGAQLFSALGGEKVLEGMSAFPLVGRLVGGGVGVGKVVEALVGKKAAQETIQKVVSNRAFEAEEAALTDIGRKSFSKLFTNPATQARATLGLQKGIEVAADMAQFVARGLAEGIVFTAGEKIVHNLGSLALHEPMESSEETTASLIDGAAVGGLFGGVVGGVKLGGLSVGKNAIKWTYKKGKSLVLWRKKDMAAAGENVGNAFISTGEDNAQSVFKTQINKVRNLLRKNPEQQKDIKEAVEINLSKVNESIAKREELYTALKKYTPEEWKQVPAALYARFARHIEDLKHFEEGGALPSNGPHSKLTKYHKDQHLGMDEAGRQFHESVHKPLETHAAERETIKKVEESKRYEQLSSKNKKLLKERLKQLGEHGEEHPLTRDLRKIDKINADIEEYNNYQRVGEAVVAPESTTTEDEINNDKFMKASENIQTEEVGKSPKEEFEEANPLDDKATEKLDEEIFDENEYANLPKEDKTVATETFNKIEKIEHDHSSITKLYDDVAKCIVGGGHG